MCHMPCRCRLQVTQRQALAAGQGMSPSKVSQLFPLAEEEVSRSLFICQVGQLCAYASQGEHVSSVLSAYWYCGLAPAPGSVRTASGHERLLCWG